MKEQIEKKIEEVLEYIIGKNVEDISYSEYMILDNKLNEIMYHEEEKRRIINLSELIENVIRDSMKEEEANYE